MLEVRAQQQKKNQKKLTDSSSALSQLNSHGGKLVGRHKFHLPDWRARGR